MSRAKPTPKLRCAVYTRKSTDEGLDQAYNSLHAQRDACEAYIQSQAGEGWGVLPQLYDDGGFSGGNMERPGLKRLLADIEAGRLDVVVVYKVDRLTRSLGDFARIVEAFDNGGVSFVSVTQSFNTTTSMGRLTLNVLLSFAQFEREVTGERIQDKIAASKARGMWMGGKPPLGYSPSPDPNERTLVVQDQEAEQVRRLFTRYLELGSVHALQRELEASGVRSKVHVTATGKTLGGAVINRGALFHLLRNRIYLGEIVHRDAVHAGLHPGIIDRELFDAVQRMLATHTRGSVARPTHASQALLKGRLFNADGAPMSPTFSRTKSGRLYRYYTSAPLQQGRAQPESDALRRLPAIQTDRFVLDLLHRLTGASDAAPLLRAEVKADAVHLLLRAEHEGDAPGEAVRRRTQLLPGEGAIAEGLDAVRVIAPVRLKFSGGRTWLIGAACKGAARRPDKVLVAALKSSHAKLCALDAAPHLPLDRLRQAKGAPDPHLRMLARLSFLAPDLQAAILAGEVPPGVTVGRLTAAELPLAWADQRRFLASHAG